MMDRVGLRKKGGRGEEGNKNNNVEKDSTWDGRGGREGRTNTFSVEGKGSI